MKTKEFNELKTKKMTELTKMVGEKRIELVKLTSRMYAGREKNLKKGKMIKRDIAQIKTVMGMNKKGEVTSK